jgi:hypothetical protein
VEVSEASYAAVDLSYHPVVDILRLIDMYWPEAAAHTHWEDRVHRWADRVDIFAEDTLAVRLLGPYAWPFVSS